MNLDDNKNFKLCKVKCVMRYADAIDTSGNEINIIYNFDKHFPKTLCWLNEYDIDEKFNQAKEIFMKGMENPEELVFNKVYASNTKFVKMSGDSFPLLFHTTSTFFLDSIREYGLGAVSIHEKYDLQGMADDLYNAFAEKKLFPPMTDNDKKDNCFWNNGTAWIAEKYGNDKILHHAFGKMGFCNRKNYTEKTSFDYGQLYFTICAFRASLHRKNLVGEYLHSIVDVYKAYHEKTNEFFRFNNPVHQELMDSIFDYETCEIASSIKPITLIVENVAFSDLLSEESKTEVAFTEIININNYINIQRSYVYTGKPIAFDNITVVEDGKTLESTAISILEKYSSGNRIIA